MKISTLSIVKQFILGELHWELFSFIYVRIRVRI